MAGTSADLLAMFNRLAGRPESDAMTDVVKYAWLEDAQLAVISEIAAIVPDVLMGAPSVMATTDGGVTFIFGTDPNGNPIEPIGQVGIYDSLSSVPDDPWSEGVDYLDEGTQIRIPGNMRFGGTLYWRGITPPIGLSDTIQPVVPLAARELVVVRAVKDFAESAEQNLDLAAAMAARWGHAFPRWLLMYRRQFKSGGGLDPLVS